ncbi:hypothetical protein BpHYR1_036225 [Brachionus plicatilis]|uniref:Uncharacterized protein n=1 Tax=Brachionus plicatilis TaxID=10195 RepID=A0A3M7S3R4_BRAPC|nr:hypothetical protein BpHYR1_036225 [Brachionus plicatilis]
MTKNFSKLYVFSFVFFDQIFHFSPTLRVIDHQAWIVVNGSTTVKSDSGVKSLRTLRLSSSAGTNSNLDNLNLSFSKPDNFWITSQSKLLFTPLQDKIFLSLE